MKRSVFVFVFVFAAAFFAAVLCGAACFAEFNCVEKAPQKAASVSSGKYTVSTQVDEILLGKSSFLVTLRGPATRDSAGSAGYIKMSVLGGENLGILPGQPYVLYSGDTSNVREFYVEKIPAEGYVRIQFTTSPRTKPAQYTIRADFPDGSYDKVKVKIVHYFGELDTEIPSEPLYITPYKPRPDDTPVPTQTPAVTQTVVTPVPTQVMVSPTQTVAPVPTQATKTPFPVLGCLIAGVMIFGAVFRRR